MVKQGKRIGFSVDTHLFRELGEFLVGRYSTALIELVKNSYDADATFVEVYGEDLDTPHGYLSVRDDGNGITKDLFETGFLRIAGRMKDAGERRSPVFKRRFTGAKGIGRLAAHKLAVFLEVESVPNQALWGKDAKPLRASIDWNKLETAETLDQVSADTVLLNDAKDLLGSSHGTAISLHCPRRPWTERELSKARTDIESFTVPPALMEQPFGVSTLFDSPLVRDVTGADPGFEVKFGGQLDTGENYWSNVAESASWLVEIDSITNPKFISYLISPLPRSGSMSVAAQRFDLEVPEEGFGFQARILVRDGHSAHAQSERFWQSSSSGVRIYHEGFRVLPYGESGDDWLWLDREYRQRSRTLSLLGDFGLRQENEDDGLSRLGRESYFGAVFVTAGHAPQLQMLVNREGYVPNPSFDWLALSVRRGLQLCIRARAAGITRRNPTTGPHKQADPVTAAFSLKKAAESTLQEADALIKTASKALNRAKTPKEIESAKDGFTEASRKTLEGLKMVEKAIQEASFLRVLASLGTQMAGFVHELNGFLGNAYQLELALDATIRSEELNKKSEKRLSVILSALGDLRRSIERQAAYFTHVISPDARRRRSKQKLRSSFDQAVNIIRHAAEERDVTILNEIPKDLESPPMFPAELTTIFSNLVSNAVKAASPAGTVKIQGTNVGNQVRLRVENTGVAVDLKQSEKWFRSFESTTLNADPVLGQGMGLGLPLTRAMLEEYGATVRFVKPSRGFKTAVEVGIPCGSNKT